MTTQADFLKTIRGAQNRANMEELLDSLQSLTGEAASTTQQGMVELATDVEAKAQSSDAVVVTPGNLGAALGELKLVTFDGVSAAGPCTATGLVVGDLILGVACLTAGALGIASTDFESAVTVADQIQQSSESNLSANDYIALVISVA